MSEILDGALSLASQQVRLFPVIANDKRPAVDDFSHRATSDTKILTQLFGETSFNSGIACGKVTENLYLVGFDIDVKKGKNGYETLELLADLGDEFPATWAQKTPSGGEHRLFWSHVPIRQGVDTVGQGIDLRGDGGYLVGPGSRVELGAYRIIHDLPIAKFPDWAIAKYEKKATVHQLPKSKRTPVEDQVTALRRSVDFLAAQEVAHEGRRSHECFRVVAQLKDFGLAHDQVMEVLLTHWKCEPMLEDEELHTTINNAYRYSRNSAGVLAPEKIFEDECATEEPLEEPTPIRKNKEGHPIDVFNRDHFYCAASGVSRVCWETTERGKFKLERFPVPVFHEKHLAEEFFDGSKNVSTTKAWMKSPRRRTYDGLRFDPSNRLEKNFYNLWRGFAVQGGAAPIPSPLAAESVNLFLEHVKENICQGDEALNQWLLNFMAHLFQYPGEKPEVALVIKGRKGTGKTIISEILNHLIGDHSIILTNKEAVMGNFNSAIEDKLLVTLDEAFWSGDKSSEGTLKGIITSSTRLITHKGHEPYTAKVFDRIVILGNEDWTVPATGDERRYAVFKIGDGRRQDRKFFGHMKDGILNRGGDQLLMQFFLNFKVDTTIVSSAPNTAGLDEQKALTMTPVQTWWKLCLDEKKLFGAGSDALPLAPTSRELHDAYLSYAQRYRHKYSPGVIAFTTTLLTILPKDVKRRTAAKRFFDLSNVSALRAAFDDHFNMKNEWHDESVDDLI